VLAIELISISKSYGNIRAVEDLTVSVDQGERLAVLGPSGCGKTTMLHLIAGLVLPDRGEIRLNGQTVSKDRRIFVEPEDRKLGVVFQDLALWPHLNVEQNLAFGLQARRLPRNEVRHRVNRTLEMVELNRYRRSKPGALSGGEQQRVALARALVLEPAILLMDEPLSSLNFELSARLRAEILRLQGRLGFALLYITHNREEAYEMASRVLVMEEGKIVRDGPPEAHSGRGAG